MLEEEHPEICYEPDADPHGERKFKHDCITAYNDMMRERAASPRVPQHERGD